MNYLNPHTLDAGIEADGVLYFMEGGHYLFRYHVDGVWNSKFIAPEDVANSFQNTPIDTGWIGDGILRTGRVARGDWFVYTAPGQRRELTLITLEGAKTFTVPLPATVLIGVGNSYYLFAGAQDTPIASNTFLCRAPFPNLYSNGRVCWGDNARPVAHHSKARLVWDLFFGSPFNTHLANEKSKSQGKDVNVLLAGLGAAEQYPFDDLVGERITLDGMLQRILARDWRE